MSQDPQGHEFLVRGRHGDFDVKEVTSLHAGTFFRPRRVSKSCYTLAPGKEVNSESYLITTLATGKITKVSSLGYELWSMMDGKTSLRAIAAALFFKHGLLDFDEIRRLVGQLHQSGLIQSNVPPLVRFHRYLSALRSPFARILIPLIRWSTVDIKIPDVDARLSRLYGLIGRLMFHPLSVLMSFLLCCLASGIFLASLWKAQYTPASFMDTPWKWFFVYLAFLPQIPVHELAHALATKHFGYRVRSFGCTLLHHVFPIFYADVTDIWTAPPLKRAIVALAGPYATWVLGSLSVLVAWIFPRYEFGLFLFAFACYASTLINLYPFLFLELDGYYILADILRCPSLRNQSMELAVSLGRGRIPRMGMRDASSALFYGIASSISVIGLAAYITWGFVHG